MSQTENLSVQQALSTIVAAVFDKLVNANERTAPSPAPPPVVSAPVFTDCDSRWRHLQPFAGVEEPAAKYDPEHRIKIDIDPDRSLEDQQLEPGSGIMLIKTEEVWATDPITREPMTKLVANTYARRLSTEEADVLAAKLYADGVMHSAMKEYFR